MPFFEDFALDHVKVDGGDIRLRYGGNGPPLLLLLLVLLVVFVIVAASLYVDSALRQMRALVKDRANRLRNKGD